MVSIEELREQRHAKLKILRDAGMDPYPIESSYDYQIDTIRSTFDELPDTPVTLVGRVMALRPQGQITFFHISDGTGRFQGVLRSGDEGGDAAREKLWHETVDLGDIVQVTGEPMRTKRGEPSVEVRSWQMLAKSLRPLPEKWHGLSDKELCARKRYLETLTDREAKQRFQTRSLIVSTLRRTLEGAGFIEVETPMLQPQAGGASAANFTTHHNALDHEFHLRVSPELYLKRLLVGGYPRVFELARNFRNEGIDATHNPEFTMLEWYQAYSDVEEQKRFVCEILRSVVEVVHGAASFSYGDETITIPETIPERRYQDLFQDECGFDYNALSQSGLVEKARELGVSVENDDSTERILDEIYKKLIRPSLIQPVIISGHPREYLPLAKAEQDSADVASAFQMVIGGLELVKAFSELNDPIDQRQRFQYQEEQRREGDDEAQQLDEPYLEALEYGMPPAGGVGIGIDRLVMLLTDTHHIRDVIFFPTLKPKDGA